MSLASPIRIGLLLALLVFAVTGGLWLRLGAILLAGWWVPGVLLVLHWRIAELDLLTAGLLASGLGICWLMMLALLLHWVPGPIQLWSLVGVYTGGALVLLLGVFLRQPARFVPRAALPLDWRWVAVLLVLAGVLRLPDLGYREFHSDEAEVLYLARDAIQGEDDAFGRHRKGPGELAIAMVTYRALGTLNEWTGRLPFALAGIAAVVATAVLGARLFSPLTGVWAGVLFIFNGYVLGLSRLVQYQPVILLLMALALLAGWEFSVRGGRRWLTLMIVFTAFGGILHYEFALVMPALLFLLWRGRRHLTQRKTRNTLVLTGSLAAIPVLIAYVRIVSHPRFNQTTAAGWRLRFGDIGAFNGKFFADLSILYNSTYFFGGLLLLVAVGLVLCWRDRRDRGLFLVIWFLPFLILYLFVLKFPGTHYYMMMESWSILAAVPLARLTSRKDVTLTVRWSTIVVVVAWLGLAAGYLYLAFFREYPAYVFNYERERHPLYWTTFGKTVPIGWRFGFPIREGWKVLGVLAEWNYFGETYDSNELSNHLRWYLGEFQRVNFDENPDFVFMATHVRERDLTIHPEQLEGFRQIGEVRVRGEPRIAIWSRHRFPAPYLTYDFEPFATVFDGVVPSFDEWEDTRTLVRGVPLGDRIALASAGLSGPQLSSGDTLHVLLQWRPTRMLERDYKLFVHIGADDLGRPFTQWDGYPGLNTARTSEWSVYSLPYIFNFSDEDAGRPLPTSTSTQSAEKVGLCVVAAVGRRWSLVREWHRASTCFEQIVNVMAKPMPHADESGTLITEPGAGEGGGVALATFHRLRPLRGRSSPGQAGTEADHHNRIVRLQPTLFYGFATGYRNTCRRRITVPVDVDVDSIHREIEVTRR